MIVILFASAGVALHYWHWDHQLKTAFAIFFILLILTSSCGVQCAGQHHKFQYANTFGLNFFFVHLRIARVVIAEDCAAPFAIALHIVFIE